ncbi:MAG: hypothetical protein DHS20C11_22180 [Lysobacteraceae bacterium]|nr:MAG: hypothetical protein DHS20C11_22180 [Xanthomonadaceae bacterium]
MMNKKMLAMVLLAVGVVLLLVGFNASNAPVEEVSEALTGRFSDETMLYLVGGGISALLGVIMLVRK